MGCVVRHLSTFVIRHDTEDGREYRSLSDAMALLMPRGRGMLVSGVRGCGCSRYDAETQHGVWTERSDWYANRDYHQALLVAYCFYFRPSLAAS